jgi:outer membrane protein TolC
MQAALAEKAAQNIKRRADVGTAGPEEVAAAQRELDEMALKVKRVQLNLEEVQRSGRAVQDDVTSPLVGGRDFVLERLTLEQKSAAAGVSAGDRRLREAQKRYDVGLTTPIELLDAQAALLRATGEMKSVGEKIALRQEFLAGRITAQEATRKRLLIAARAEMESAVSDLDVLSKRYALLQKQQNVGVTSDVDVLRAQLEMLSRKQDVERLRARIAALEQRRE